MKVLVAGGAGFIGKNLCAELVDRGHEVTALSRHPDGDGLPDGVETAVGDVTAYDSIVEPVSAADAVVNLVALSPLFDQPAGSHERVHLGGTENLVRAAEEAGIDRFVQMSGLDASPAAKTAYLRAKGEAEAVVRESDLAWTIVRPSVVFGDGAEFLAFVRLLTTPYLTGLPGGGSMQFQPIWVGDLVGMLADALEDDAHVGCTYELGGPAVLSLADVTKLVYAADGRSVRILPIPTPLAKLGLGLGDPIPFVPFGAEQARSLEVDNTVEANDVTAFGVDESGLTTFGAYLGLESVD